MLALLRSCWDLVPPGTGWRWASLIPLALVTVAFEAAGAAAVFVLTRVLAEPAAATTMPVVGPLVRRLPAQDGRSVIIAVAAATALLYLVKNVVAVAAASLRGRCVEDATAATATALLRGYLGAPWVLHLRRNSAELIYNADQAVQRVFGGVMAAGLALATEVLVAVGIVGVLMAAAPGTTLVASALLLALSWLFLRVTRLRAVALGARLDAVREGVLRQLQHALGGAKEIAVLGRAQSFVDAFARDQAELARVRWRYGVFAALPRLGVETVFVCGALLVVVLAAFEAGTGVDSLPLLGLYAYAGFRVIPSANRIVWHLSEIRFGSPAIERVRQDLALARTPAASAGRPCRFDDRLVLDGVVYTYPEAARPTLAHMDLVIRRGESVGIVGPTGAGKSTLIDLIVGLLDPAAGRITVDGVDLRDCRVAWQARIGYVPQVVFLVDDTLRANVALGVPAAEVDGARVRAAVRRAQLDDFLSALPAGLETMVGERGVRLSGGERQRVGIARALYREPDLLVLDEATSALDPRTEADLARAIEDLRGDTTLILVAHRLTTVQRCDRLIVLDDGRVADAGTYDELIDRSPAFRALAAVRAAG